ncbi:MAG TPA: ATP-binding protein, partial [Bdellovibrio sp.]|nr:ATP-binding protein [Bdellovibrio sp.]
CRKGLQFQIHYPSMDAVLIGDALRLKQVILNLLGNAVKFTDRGGIELSIRLEEISSDPGIRRVRFEVKDTGVGIAQENLEKIFDKFRQEDSSVTRRFGGSGLGLSISKEIIEMMHGQLFYHSSQSVGSTFGFYVDLPLISQAPWISQTTYQTPSIMSGLTFDEDGTTAPRIRRVLLVDDMDENHVLLRAYMKSIPNLEVDSAYTGMECLEKCQENHYDLIFMDIQMPNMSGLETIRLLREGEKQNQMPRVPVIVVSANSFIEDREKSLAVGADEHCGKPVRKQMIMELIEKYCSKKAENLNVN